MNNLARSTSIALLAGTALLLAAPAYAGHGGHGGGGGHMGGGGHGGGGGHWGGGGGGHWGGGGGHWGGGHGGYHGGYHGGHYGHGYHGGHYGYGYGGWWPGIALSFGYPYGYGYPYYGDSYYGSGYYDSGYYDSGYGGGDYYNQTNYWYRCADPDGYYPYVRVCRSNWLLETPSVPPVAHGPVAPVDHAYPPVRGENQYGAPPEHYADQGPPADLGEPYGAVPPDVGAGSPAAHDGTYRNAPADYRAEAGPPLPGGSVGDIPH
jgi:hypothetical protein